MKTGTRRGVLLAVGVLVAVVLAGGAAIAQAPTTPHPLLGRWDGEFKNQYATGDVQRVANSGALRLIPHSSVPGDCA
jgi:hypothetical protein